MCTCSGHVDINQLVVRIDSLNVCAGHPEGRFSEVASQGEERESYECQWQSCGIGG